MIRKSILLMTMLFLLAGQRLTAQVTNSIGVTMIKVEGGTFTMGRNTDSFEKPEHQVTVDGFYISETEITVRQYKRIMNNDSSWNEFSNNPKGWLTWYQAVEFCNKLSDYEGLKPFYTIDKTRKDPNNLLSHDPLKYLVTYNWDADGYRLPFEAEWEFAARGGNKSKGYIYSGGNDPSLVGQFNLRAPQDISSLLPNELGLYDMSGNIAEYCNDWKSDLSSNPDTNPKGEKSSMTRVVKGGDFSTLPHWMKPSFRSSSQPYVTEATNGIRVVRPITAKIKHFKVEYTKDDIMKVYNRAKLFNKTENYESALKNYLLADELYTQFVGANDENKGNILNAIGVCYYYLSDYSKAIEMYKRTLDIYQKIFGENHSYVAKVYSNMAMAYNESGDYSNAISYYHKTIALEEKLDANSNPMRYYESIANIYNKQEKYSDALAAFKRVQELKEKNKESTLIPQINIAAMYFYMEETQKAFDMFQSLLEPVKKEFGAQSKNYASLITYMGQVYENLSEYSKSLALYQEALPIYEKEYGAESSQTAMVYNNIGQVYSLMGILDKALEFNLKALSMREKAEGKMSENTAQSLNNLGSIYISKKDYPKALEYLTQSLETYQKLKGEKHKMVAIASNGVGVAQLKMKNYEKSLSYFNKSLAIREQLFGKDSKDLAPVLNNIANIYYEYYKENKKALEFYQRSIAISEKSWGADITITYQNIANIYSEMGEYDKAIEYLNKTIAVFEKVRATNIPEIDKINYFSAILDTYQFLIKINVSAGYIDKAYEVRELSSAKYLLEKIGEKAGSAQPKPFNIDDYTRAIPNEHAIVSFANANWGNIIILVATKGYFGGISVSKKDFVEKVKSKITAQSINSIDNTAKRGFRVISGEYGVNGKSANVNTSEYNQEFENIINYYHTLLQSPTTSNLNYSDFTLISKELYNLFIEPLKKLIGEKKDLLICPDGLLNLIPFEAFISDQNHYLVEDYQISYSQSLSVLHQLSQRSNPAKNGSILAFGGALYQDKNSTSTLGNIEMNEYNIKSSLTTGTATEIFSKLNIQWDNLPGTLEEVKAIKKAANKASYIDGKKVNEDNIKLMSQKGDLKKYSVIHFATHGIVIPEFPELSSIVLSQVKDEKSKEDGYLTMKEILNLNLECDFVNLSACETGLGKVVVGEGIIGLTQSFLVSGANGISVSLWKIADESTAQFMAGMYGMSEKENLVYKQALSEMKRKFIKDSKYSSAFYWAPFVYYGK